MKEKIQQGELAALLLVLPESLSFSVSRYPKPGERTNTMTDLRFAKQQQKSFSVYMMFEFARTNEFQWTCNWIVDCRMRGWHIQYKYNVLKSFMYHLEFFGTFFFMPDVLGVMHDILIVLPLFPEASWPLLPFPWVCDGINCLKSVYKFIWSFQAHSKFRCMEVNKWSQ